MKLNLRVALIGLVALVAIGGLLRVSSPMPLGVTATKHVTLVVDFGSQSARPAIVKRLTGLAASATGWSLFSAASISVEGTAQYPAGFVCRIAGWPSNATEDCKNTPGAKGHWAYFVTDQRLGHGWVLSGQGASQHVSPCGAWEGWLWVGEGVSASSPSVAPKLDAAGCQK